MVATAGPESKRGGPARLFQVPATRPPPGVGQGQTVPAPAGFYLPTHVAESGDGPADRKHGRVRSGPAWSARRCTGLRTERRTPRIDG